MAEEPQKIYECPTCGKQFLKKEQYGGHMRQHQSQDDLTEKIKAAVAEALSKQAATTSPLLASSANPPATSFVSTPSSPPPVRHVQFIVKPKPATMTEDIICPNCGGMEIDRPMTVIEKPVTEEVEVIPKGFIRAPQGGNDWLRILDLRHLDGKPIDECPDCAKALLSWFNQHKAKLERASRGQ